MTTVFIDDRTAKGKSLLKFLKTLEGENFIRFTFEPNDETKKAIEEARKGKLKSYKDSNELFASIKSQADV